MDDSKKKNTFKYNSKMAPLKKPKDALKSMQKPTEIFIIKSKKPKKRNYYSFSRYIFKLMKNVLKENFGISTKSMMIMNNFVNDMIEKIAEEAGRLVVHSKKVTLGSAEIRTAIKLLVPGQLARHALIEGAKALKTYNNNK